MKNKTNLSNTKFTNRDIRPSSGSEAIILVLVFVITTFCEIAEYNTFETLL
ncbi:hypothetical protein GYMC10_4520 [Paenibacillus sp. Y412MC10]|nr:hypothetical protein GYMC10_4520 [Paenibacillus sp. Y412MC10]